MNNLRAGAWAMIAGAILTILVFTFHPSHVIEQPLVGPFTLSQLVHGTALAAVPLMVFGLWQFGEWLGLEEPAVRFAVLLTFLAATATVNAAVISNFVTPVAAHASADAIKAHEPATAAPSHAARPRPHAMPPLVSLSVAMNRGFAQVHVAFLSLALLLFGLAVRSRSTVLGWAGAMVGAGPLLWQLSGTFGPSTHTMPLVVYPQAIWMIAAAFVMMKSQRSG